MIAPARRAAMAALLAVELGRADLDTAIDRAREGLADPRDLALLHEIVTGTLRWQGRLDWFLAAGSSVPLARLDPEVLVALRMGAYQLQHLDRTPARAVVDDAVALVKRARKSSAAGFVNAVLRRLARGDWRALPDPAAAADGEAFAAALAVTAAHPRWLVDRWLARESRDVVEAWLTFDNAAAPLVLRVNPLAAGGRDAAGRLSARGVETHPCRWAPLGLVVDGGPSPELSRALEAGEVFLQDEGSQLAALVAPVAAGHRVLDLCAAPGGKTLAYAAAAGPAGRVVACDVRPRRLDLLAGTLRRAGAHRASVVGVGERDPLPFGPVFDVVAVDAPCSGLGTLRRDPDIKWRRRPADLAAYHARQVDLIRRASAAVAPGGTLVYTTCSTEPEENDEVVARFLRDTPAFEQRSAAGGPGGRLLAEFVGADGWLRLHPARHGLEGYCGAVLARRAGGRS
ncbi:MAG: transcription antitermination factor NusB [Vicinamibacterales bacterium]